MSPFQSPEYLSIQAFWQEPDYFEGEMSGFKVIARRNHAKAWCGYVGVPDTHALYGKHYDHRIPVSNRGQVSVSPHMSPIAMMLEAMAEDDGHIILSIFVDCHGGLTYANSGWPADDGLWYFGFDCSHAGDLSPQDVFLSFSGYSFTRDYSYTYRTLDYVKEQLAVLATKLESLA